LAAVCKRKPLTTNSLSVLSATLPTAIGPCRSDSRQAAELAYTSAWDTTAEICHLLPASLPVSIPLFHVITQKPA